MTTDATLGQRFRRLRARAISYPSIDYNGLMADTLEIEAAIVTLAGALGAPDPWLALVLTLDLDQVLKGTTLLND